jgi:hypothetical protein
MSMGGSFSTFSIFDWLLVSTTIGLSLLIIWGLIKNGNFSKRKNPTWGCDPLPRNKKLFPFKWLNGWAHWKSGVYQGKELNNEIAYIGHQAIQIKKNKVTVRSDGWLYAKKSICGIVFGMVFILGILISTKEFLKLYNYRNFCPVIIQKENNDQDIKLKMLPDGIINILKGQVCIIKNILFYDDRYDSFEKKMSRLFSHNYWGYYLFIIGFFALLRIFLSKAPPPLVFDRKKRLIYTQYKNKLYLSDWDKAYYTIQVNSQSYIVGFELYHIDKKGNWVPKWFTIAGHHYYGEVNEYLLSLKAIHSDRSHAMRAWLILFMEKGELAVHPVLPFKGILDDLTPRKEKLDDDIEQQVTALLERFNYKAPGNAEKATKFNPEIEPLLKKNNDVDLYDILSEKNLAKYIANREAQDV